MTRRIVVFFASIVLIWTAGCSKQQADWSNGRTGTTLVLKLSNCTDNGAALEAAEIISARAMEFGAIHQVDVTDDGSIKLLIAPFDDMESLTSCVSMTGQLSFQFEAQDLLADGVQTLPFMYSDDELALEPEVQIATHDVDYTYISVDFERPIVHMAFKDLLKLGKVTEGGINRRLAIVLDGSIHSAPVIKEAIHGNVMITGLEKVGEAAALSIALNSGPHPCALQIVSQAPLTQDEWVASNR